MTNRQRFKNVLAFQPADRLPFIEWAGWWNKTIERWHTEGLPAELTDSVEIQTWLGLDRHRQFWYGALGPEFPRYAGISSLDDYLAGRDKLYPAQPANAEAVRLAAEEQKKGESAVWITLDGFFWGPRNFFGIEKHLYAFYDLPEVMHRINSDLLDYNLRTLDAFCRICVPDFMTFAEDMSYNHGPMLSKDLFDEFIAPYYRKIIPRLKEYGIVPIIDSDGQVEKLLDWFAEVGVDGFLPLERQAGVDLPALRKKHPRVRFIGGFDKMVMNRGEEALRLEFERLLPVMRQGGYIPSVDHQTPPGISLENYRLYVELLKEYCVKAIR